MYESILVKVTGFVKPACSPTRFERQVLEMVKTQLRNVHPFDFTNFLVHLNFVSPILTLLFRTEESVIVLSAKRWNMATTNLY